MFEKVLVGVDLSYDERNTKTLQTAVSIANANNGSLRLVYVRSSLVSIAPAYIPPGTMEADEKAVLADLQALADTLDIPSDRVSVASPADRAYSGIVSEAAAFGADLIVIGAHSPSMTKFLLGSDAHRVVQHAPISVLVAR